MTISRRNLIKISGISVITIAMGGYTVDTKSAICNLPDREFMPISNGKRVIVFGANSIGLAIERYPETIDENIEIVVLEKRDSLVPHPYMSGSRGITLDTPFFNFFLPTTKKSCHFIQTAVAYFDRANKLVETDYGTMRYDYLVTSDGAEHNHLKYYRKDNNTLSA